MRSSQLPSSHPQNIKYKIKSNKGAGQKAARRHGSMWFKWRCKRGFTPLPLWPSLHFTPLTPALYLHVQKGCVLKCLGICLHSAQVCDLFEWPWKLLIHGVSPNCVFQDVVSARRERFWNMAYGSRLSVTVSALTVCLSVWTERNL